MDEKGAATIKRLADVMANAVDPLDRLRASKQLRELAEDLERRCGRAAREAGTSWSSIGEVYGASKQAMAQRFRHASG